MRVTVDLDRCEANAACVGLAPEVFPLGGRR
jgi:ferredoxin